MISARGGNKRKARANARASEMPAYSGRYAEVTHSASSYFLPSPPARPVMVVARLTRAITSGGVSYIDSIVAWTS